MFDVVAEAVIKPFRPDPQIPAVLEAAYELYLQAPQHSNPLINLRQLSQQTGLTPLACRNIIVNANQHGQFPNCSLSL